MWQRRLLVLLIVVAFPSGVASGQSMGTTVSLDFGMYYATLQGDDFAEAKGAIGFDGVVRYRSPSFSLGVGYMWVDHDREGFSSDTRYLDGVFIEPRFSLPPVRGIFSTYVMGRAARLHQELTTDIDDIATDLKSDGYSIGGGVGLAGQAAFLAFDISVYYSAVSFGDFEAPARDGTIPGSSANGSSLGVRFASALVFGPWGRGSD